MTMGDKLARLLACTGQAQAVDDVIQPALEQLQQGLSSQPARSQGQSEKPAELAFSQSIHTLDFLFLTQLHGILGWAASWPASMHAGRLLQPSLQAFTAGAEQIHTLAPG
jgi:hypothetical protein